jgi:hypothetical protein
MSCVRLAAPAAVLLIVAASGCGTSARLVQTTPDGGIVAIPKNDNGWPYRYRETAEKLMAEKCPNGYEIVGEGEVVVGKRNTIGANNTMPSGSPIGTPGTQDKTEWRITFRAKPPAAALAGPLPTPPGPPAPAVATVSVPALTAGLPARPIPVAP